MQHKSHQPRQYIQFSNAAVKAVLAAIDNFNRVHGDYKTETTLILLVNAWELLAKAVLIKKKKNIYSNRSQKETISCEKAIKHLLELKEIDNNKAVLLQQIVSLRNECAHCSLPEVQEAILHHLLFFGCKFFKELSIKHFSKTEKQLKRNFLTISFDQLTTYAAQVQKTISKLRRGKPSEKKLVWLLERGIRYLDSGEYISQREFEKLYKHKRKIMPWLKIGTYIKEAEMVRIVPVQAPKNWTADVQLRKGPKNLKEPLPVTIKKTRVEDDYEFLTKDIAEKTGKSINFTARAMSDLGLKGNPEYHQSIRTSDSSAVHRYPQSALNFLKKYLDKHPNYNPYHR